MSEQKKYWCFTCNSECQINIIKQDEDEEYQCSKCKNTFIEEISAEDNPSHFHIQQPNQSSNVPQHIDSFTSNSNGIHITISNVNSMNNININNFNNFNNDGENNQNNENEPEPEYECGIDGTFLFLPSTVHYRRQDTNRNRILNNFFNGGEIITGVVNPNGQNIIISRSSFSNNNLLNNFLSTHRNDHQFENFINILMALDLQHEGNPPASEKAINSLKRTEINENNIKEFNEQTCNICLDNFVKGQITVSLECGHFFHGNCIINWLKMRNTCPVCRHELESNDPNYEKRKHLHRETMRNLHNNSGNNNNNNEPPSSPA